MAKISIKTNILTIVLLIVGIIALSLLFSQYYFSKKLAITSTHKTFNIITQNIRTHLHETGINTRNIITAKSKHNELLEPITFDPFHPAWEGLIQVLQIKDNLHAIYFAHPDGKFYEIINMRERPLLYKTFHAPSKTYWTIVTIIDNIQQNAFLDKNFKLIHTSKFAKPYNLYQRSWYHDALNKQSIIATMPYFFVNAHQMGITYAKELNTKGVVLALDYTMEQLNHILALQSPNKHAEVFIVDSKGEKFASSAFGKETKSILVHEVLREMLDKKETNKIIQYTEGTHHYFMMFSTLISKNTYLGIKIDAEVLLKPYRDNIQYSFIIAVILLLLSLPIIILSTHHIIKPIKALILENDKIKNHQFSEVTAIDTNITEFEALSASQVSLSKSIQVYQKSQEDLLDAIIKLMAEAIDEKSPYTGKHCARVPELAQLLLQEVNTSTTEVFKDFSLTSENALREFEIGAWLHDCGKVTTPEYVVDKATKLETIYNRIHEIRMRFEVLWRDVQIEYLQEHISLETMKKQQNHLREDFAFIASNNMGGEFMDESKQARIKEIAQKQWQRNFDDTLGLGPVEIRRYTHKTPKILPVMETLLSDKAHHIVPRENFNHDVYASEGFKLEVPKHLYNYGEVYNLCIDKGTLSPEERYKINEHVIMSIKMLEKIPFPSHLSRIPEYAGTHHETLIGTGYPKKLSKSDLSIPARIMAIADIFEALTASDRPYKKAKTLSESIKIMGFMAKDQHIDADIFKLFLTSGIYKMYAQKHLKTEQIDKVDISSYLA